MSAKYRQAEANGNLEEAERIILEDIEPFLRAKESHVIRSEELLLNFNRIKESLKKRKAQKTKKSK